MHILLTTHQFFPEFGSGTEVLTLGVARELLRRGHEVTVLTGFPQGDSPIADSARHDRYIHDGIHVHRFRHSFVPMGGQSVIAEIEHDNHLVNALFRELLGATKPDLVHFFHFSRLGVGIVDALRPFGIPGFYTPTDFWAVCPTSQLLLREGRVCAGPDKWSGNCVKHIATKTRHGKFNRLLEAIPVPAFGGIVRLAATGRLPHFPKSDEIRALSRRLDFNISRLNLLKGICAPTGFMAKTLIDYGVSPDIVHPVGYGIELPATVAPLRNPVAGNFRFGFIGTLGQHKGCHLLIDAFLRSGLDAARLYIYGNGGDFPGYYQSLQDAAGGDSRIEFRGTFPNGRIGEVLGNLDALVVPSIWYENAPLVVHSALAAKCPVLASNFPGMNEVVRHGRNGLLFTPGDVHELADQMRSLVRNPEMHAQLSAHCQAPKTVKEYVDEIYEIWVTAGALAAQRPPDRPRSENGMPAVM